MTATISPTPEVVTGPRAGYVPQQKQYVAHTCPAQHIFYGGAAGPGKSAWGVNEIIWYALRHPGSHQLIVRRKIKELAKLSRDMRVWMPKGAAKWNANDKQFTMRDEHPERGHGTITFSQIFHDADVSDHYGFEYDRIFIDESTHFNQWVRDQLQSRNRSPLYPQDVKFLLASNPGNVGHYDMLERFVKPPDTNVELLYFFDPDAHPHWPGYEGAWRRFPPGFRGKPAPMVVWRPEADSSWDEINRQRVAMGLAPAENPTRVFIPGVITDNKYLNEDPQYVANLLSLPEKMKRALYYGDWDAFEGQVFTEFDESKHVIDHIEPRPTWTLWRGLDHGYRDPLSVHWLAYAPERQQIVVFRELYETGLHDSEAARKILAMTNQRERVMFNAAPHDMFRGDSNDTAESHAEAYQRNGVPLMRSIGDPSARLAKAHEFLSTNPKTGQPYCVFTRDCRNLLRTLPTLVYDEKEAEKISRNAEDHAYDSWTYGLMMAPAFSKPRRRKPMQAGAFWSSPTGR